jgi:protein tyrosine/serine phosphatase
VLRKKNVKKIALIISAFVLLVATCGAQTISGDGSSPSANFHQLEGVPNFHKISENVYRSGQPTAGGFRNLKTIGIKTIIDLRWFHSDRNEVRDCGLEYEHINMTVLYPEENQAVKFLRIVSDQRGTPVLVHCQHGADRTGVMCAIYRIAVQGWTKEKALKEMVEGGFGFHGIWGHLAQWVNKLDIEKIKQKAGIMEHVEVGPLETKQPSPQIWATSPPISN